jgi:hypothetical protein
MTASSRCQRIFPAKKGGDGLCYSGIGAFFP